MWRSKADYIKVLVDDICSNPLAYNIERRSNKEIERLESKIEHELLVYKNMHYRKYGKKPTWLSMDNINQITAEVISQVKDYFSETPDFI